MNKRAVYLIAFAFSCISCGSNSQKENIELNRAKLDSLRTDSLASALLKYSQFLKESNDEEDEILNEYLEDQLRPIRLNFKRINSINKWTSIIKKDIWVTTEGGEVSFCYWNKFLEKIISRQYGETFQRISEYYLLNGQISFVLEKTYKYNRPLYYDSATMIENNDTEFFDFEKSEIIEDRSYFEKGKLLHQINNQDCGSPFSDGYLIKEQKRILSNFERLLKLEKE